MWIICVYSPRSLRFDTKPFHVGFRRQKKKHWESFSPTTSVFLFSVSFHQCSILIFSLVKRTSRRSLGTLKNSSAFWDIGKLWTEKHFHLVSFRLQILKNLVSFGKPGRNVRFIAISFHPSYSYSVLTSGTSSWQRSWNGNHTHGSKAKELEIIFKFPHSSGLMSYTTPFP